MWGTACGSVEGWLNDRSVEQVEREERDRRRRRAERPTLIQRSQSSIDRIDYHTKQSERNANKAADIKLQLENKTKLEEEEQRKQRTARRRQQEEKQQETDSAEEEDVDAAVEEELAIPAGFYYAKQYDFFATIRTKADKQRRQRQKEQLKQQQQRTTATQSSTFSSPEQPVRTAAAAEERKEAEASGGGVDRRGAGWKEEEKEQVIARGRKSDWLVDGWWELKHHVEETKTADLPTDHTTGSPQSSASASGTGKVHSQPLTSALLYPNTPSPALVRSLFPPHSTTPPPLSYTPLTPLYLSSRADYLSLQPHLLDLFALNTLTKAEASRSALEQQQLDVWVERLPVVGCVDGGGAAGGGGGKELMRVSGVVRRSAGEDVYRAGEIGTCFYVLLQGRVQLVGAAAVAVTVGGTGGGGSGKDERREKERELVRPSTADARSHNASNRGSLNSNSTISIPASRPITPSIPTSYRHSLNPTTGSLVTNTATTSPRPGTADTLPRRTALPRPASAAAGTSSLRLPLRPISAPTSAVESVEVRVLTPFSVFGRRREETDDRTATGATSGGNTAISVSGKRGWARVRAVLNVSRAFQMNQIGKLADSRTRSDTVRCLDDTMLLCVMYSEYDRISRQHVDRQSRHVVALLRTLEAPLSRLRMRQLHRLARALQPIHIPPNEPLLPATPLSSHSVGPPALLLLESGSAVCTKSVDVLRYGRAAGVRLASWQVEERRIRRTIRVSEVSGLTVLGYEAVLGSGSYDGNWRAVSDCHGFLLQRSDFHLLMHTTTLDGISTIVANQREQIKQRITHAIESDDHSTTTAANLCAMAIQRAMSVHAHAAGSATQVKARHKVQLNTTLLPSPFSTTMRSSVMEGEVGGGRGRLMRRRSSVMDVSHLHGRAKQQLHDTMVVQVSFGDFATLQ